MACSADWGSRSGGDFGGSLPQLRPDGGTTATVGLLFKPLADLTGLNRRGPPVGEPRRRIRLLVIRGRRRIPDRNAYLFVFAGFFISSIIFVLIMRNFCVPRDPCQQNLITVDNDE